MSEEKQVKNIPGVLDFIKEANTMTQKRDGTPMKQPLHSIGIKLADGTWHNIQSFDSQEKCEEVLNKPDNRGKFVKGDSIVLVEESTPEGKYPHIVAIIESDQVPSEVVKTNDEIAKEQGRVIGEVKDGNIVPVNNENTIEKQCCLKCACMLGGIQMKEDALKTAAWFYAQLGNKWLE